MKMYYLFRKEDVSGMSGTGYVAEVAEFDDGSVVVRWIGTMNMSGITSTTVFSSLDDLRRVHGHHGRTDVELVLDSDRLLELERTVESLRNCLQQARETLEKNGLADPIGC